MSRVENVVECLSDGGLAVIADAGRRSGQGSLALVAEFADEAAMARLMELGGGLLVLCMPPERFSQLGLTTLDDPRHRGEGAQGFGTPILARDATSAGVSAADRAATVAAAVAPNAARDDLVIPGTVFPAQAGAHGLFTRKRRIEAAVDLARLAGSRSQSAVLSEVLGSAKQVLRGSQLKRAAAAAGVPLVSVEDVLRYRRLTEPIMDPPVVVRLPTPSGVFRVAAYHDRMTDVTHLALSLAEPGDGAAAAGESRVYVHDPCRLGDALGRCRSRCGERLDAALDELASGRLDLVVYQGSREPWQHLFDQVGQDGPGAPAQDCRRTDGVAEADLERYGVVSRIVADFEGGAQPGT